MTEEAQGRQRKPSKLWMPALALTILVAVIVLPPLFSMNRYKARIAGAMSNSLGRPVHLSGVELRILPRPGFVITDLTVQEDPAFGAEPVLYANQVKAAIRLFSLWRGRLEISRISVDEASLNLVRTTDGRWNLDSLFRNAAQAQPGGSKPRRQSLPYLEATNSRINIKKGIEKLPYSLLNADLSFWEENPGDWRARLKGQPARTDVSLELGDTGIVQLEASMRRAPELKLMPVHVELEWRQAQLGQLSRLLVGSDPGWRGDLTAEMKLDGTAESANVTTRLRASGVHRAEFAPAEPLDFDANCGLIYHYSDRTIEKLACNSPLGNGRLLIQGNLPSNGQPKLSLQLDKIPAQAILDALRTVRNQVGAGLEANGTLSGRLDYDAALPPPTLPPPVPHTRSLRHPKPSAAERAPTPGPLTGSIDIDSLRLSGGSLTQPILIQKASLQPATSDDGKSQLLAGSSTIPAGAPTPLAVSVRLSQTGYQVTVKGNGTAPRLRQIAQVAGLKEADALDSIAGDPIALDLSITGPWLPAPEILLAESAGISAAPVVGGPAVPAQFIPDRLNGTLTLHNATWKTDSLANTVEIPQAVLHLSGGTKTWDPVSFVYGPVKGTARVVIPVCDPEQPCPPKVSLDFPTLDAGELQATLLGSEKKGTLLSSVISRITSSSSDRNWPSFEASLSAGSLILGPVTLDKATANLKLEPAAAELTSLDADLFGGTIHLAGKIENGDKPAYTLQGQADGIEPAEFCRMLELKCTGRPLDATGKVQLAGFTDTDLGSSAKGTLHFDWKKGAISGPTAEAAEPIPPSLTRFDSWTADAEIANNSASLGDNSVKTGARTATVKAAVTFGLPPRVTFGVPKPVIPKK
jgi:uncharacterized protein involved in outer membrane biogenesis